MAIPKIIGSQRDFSAGELNEQMKRADGQEIVKSGARQMSNWRVLSGGPIRNRPGRRALFLESGRVEEVQVSPGNIFFLAFGDRYVRVYNYAGAKVAESFVKGDGRPIPWRNAPNISNVNSIVFCVSPQAQPQIVITYPHDFPVNPPQVLTWDGVSQTSSWTISNFTEAVLGSGQKRTIFDRLSKQNVTILPSAITGNITLTASDSVFQAGMVGCRLLWCGRELLLTGYVGSTVMNAKVIEQLPNTVQVDIGTFVDIGNNNKAFVPGANGYFLPGDLVEGAISGTKGIVISSQQAIVLAGAAQNLFFAMGLLINVQIIPSANPSPISYYLPGTVGLTQYFMWQENIVGQNGNGQVGATGLLPPSAVSVWDDEVMNNFRGWPTSCFYDQGRLGFCGFGVAPSAIAWSSIGLPTDLYVNGLATSVNADNAIYEKAPSGNVQFVVPGMESSEFVFCDKAVYYITITAQIPLTPGSVQFNLLSSQGNYPGVQPKQIEQSIIYVRAGGASLGAVQTTGYYARPHIIDVVSELHSHLFTAAAPVALAVPQAPTQFEENYAYLLRADGVIVMSKYLIRNGLLEPGVDGKPKMGWLPWTSAGFPTWISAEGGDLIVTTAYSYVPNITGDPFSSGFSDGFGLGTFQLMTVSIVEALDIHEHLDSALSFNAPPTALTPPAGLGPLWFLPGGSVTIIDAAMRVQGVFGIDGSGNIQNMPDALTGTELRAGQPWTAILEPFTPDAPPGQSSGQRMKKRRISKMTVYVSDSSGFAMARLYSNPPEPGNPKGPQAGDIVNTIRFDIDFRYPEPFREEARRWRPLGREFDPRVAIIKDTPGPLLVHEIGLEASV